MSYDPKSRPPYIVPEHERTNPNRLSEPWRYMTVADQNQNEIPVVEKPPTGIAQVLNILKIVALVLAGLAGSIVAAATSGVQLPGWLVAVATAILAIATPLGIASPGLKPGQPAAPAPSEPKVGPPAE